MPVWRGCCTWWLNSNIAGIAGKRFLRFANFYNSVWRLLQFRPLKFWISGGEAHECNLRPWVVPKNIRRLRFIG